MGFLDNSGDILLDAVLTDTGRARLSRGDGSFKVAKFALGDDEIVYSAYNKNHSSGSAYYDLDILQTPVFEAFTNNTSLMKSKLISIPRTNLMYLPILKLNDVSINTKMYDTLNQFVVLVDKETEEDGPIGNAVRTEGGIMLGYSAAGSTGNVLLDQGLDTNEISPATGLDPDLYERQYIIEIDNRLGSIISSGYQGLSAKFGAGGTAASVSFVDDDNIASYYLSLGTDAQFVQPNNTKFTKTESQGKEEVLEGPRGSRLAFKIRSSIELQQSTFLFEQLGSTFTLEGVSCHYIDTNVRVTAVTTGYRVDVPVRFVKKQ